MSENKRGGLKKIRDASNYCKSEEHNPPSHIVLEPGTYEYECPRCGHKQVFTVPNITCMA